MSFTKVVPLFNSLRHRNELTEDNESRIEARKYSD